MRSDSEIIALAWDDKASFEMIEDQTGLSEKGIIKLMRRSLSRDLSGSGGTRKRPPSKTR